MYLQRLNSENGFYILRVIKIPSPKATSITF